MSLAVRMLLYYAFAAIGGAGLATFDPAGTLTVSISVDQATSLAVSAAGFLGTFAWSRFAKARGGRT